MKRELKGIIFDCQLKIDTTDNEEGAGRTQSAESKAQGVEEGIEGCHPLRHALCDYNGSLIFISILPKISFPFETTILYSFLCP